MKKRSLCIHMLLSSILSTAFCSHTYAFSYTLNPITSALTATNLLTAGAVYWKHKKAQEVQSEFEDLSESYEQQSEQLAAHKEKCKELQHIIDDFKNEITQKQNEQEFLTSIDQVIETIQHTYNQELALIAHETIESDSFTRAIIEVMSAHCASNGISPHMLRNNVLTELATLVKCNSAITFAHTEWKKSPPRSALTNQAQQQKETLELLIDQLRILSDTLTAQEEFINLSDGVTYLMQKRQLELECAQQHENPEKFVDAIKELIRTEMSDESIKFPYLAYLKTIKSELEQFRTRLLAVESKEYKPFQIEFIEQARNLYSLLDHLAISLANSKQYKKEKKSKPAFEREQQKHEAKLRAQELRTQAKLQDQEARIEREKRKDDIRLQKEKTKEEQLKHNQRIFEQERKKLELKESEIVLEITRIKDGENVKHALDENNSVWQQQVALFDKKYTTLENQHEQLKKEYVELHNELDKTITDNAELETHMRTMQKANQQLNLDLDNIIEKNSKELNAIQNKLSTIYAGIESIESNLQSAPIDGEAESIQEYIDTLRAQIMSLKDII